MRISDWSSDVCSSDLLFDQRAAREVVGEAGLLLEETRFGVETVDRHGEAVRRTELDRAAAAPALHVALEEEWREVRGHRDVGERHDIRSDTGAIDAAGPISAVRHRTVDMTRESRARLGW